MTQYLLDTNICIYYFKGQFNLKIKFDQIGIKNCAISEITLAELIYGAEKSLRKEENRKVIEEFTNRITIIPIFNSIDTFAKEKVRLKKIGQLVDDFDLLIGATAISHDLILSTRNTKHFDRLEGIKIENWIDANDQS